MADDNMNNAPQGGSENMQPQSSGNGKAWGWVVLIIIILLVIWGLFALGNDDADVTPDEDTVEDIQEDLEDTDVDEGDTVEDIEAEVEAGADADAMMEE